MQLPGIKKRHQGQDNFKNTTIHATRLQTFTNGYQTFFILIISLLTKTITNEKQGGNS